jgi:hypothetical protein
LDSRRDAPLVRLHLGGPPAFAGCKPILNAFQFDNNGQNIQFTGRKFMLLTA